MGMQLSDSTNKTGLYELFQDLTKTTTASYSLYKFSRDANNAYARYDYLALRASQKMEFDDTNQSDYPIITLNIVSGQQDYAITTDGSSPTNQILNINRIECKDSSGVWRVLTPYDQSDEEGSLTQNALTQGIPRRYDKLANGIFLDPVPNYSSSNGLKIYYGRTPVYFIGDGAHNTVVPGIPDIFHPFLAYLPAYLYCLTNMPSLAPGYWTKVLQMEDDISKFYYWRNKDERKNMKVRIDNSR